MKFTQPIYIFDARRSGLGRLGGQFKELSASTLAAQVAAAVVPQQDFPVGEVVAGQVIQAGVGMNLARQVSLELGFPHETPAWTINMVCGSGMKAVGLAAEHIASGEVEAALAFGVESMSNAPYLLKGNRWGDRFGDATMRDAILSDALTDPLLNCSMGDLAENIAQKYQIPRAEQDRWALRSHQLAAAAADDFQRETVAVQTKAGSITRDEHIRADTTTEKLGSLKPAFRDEGTVTAGNAAGINDGAAALLLGGESVATRMPPRARIVGYAATGCDPAFMGMGPVESLRKLTREVGWSFEDVGAIEINEAFACQTLACIQELGLPEEKVNQRGGAVALGHPVGCSGARVLVTLLHLMEDRKYARGLASLCVGGGMGIAMALELCSPA